MQEQEEHMTQKDFFKSQPKWVEGVFKDFLAGQFEEEQSAPCAQGETSCSASSEKENVLQQQSKQSEANVGHLRKRPALDPDEEASSSKRACLDKSSPDEHEKDSFDDLMRKLNKDVKRILATLQDAEQADNGNKAILSEFLKQLKRGFGKKIHVTTTISGHNSKYVEVDRKIGSLNQEKPSLTAAPLLVNLEQQSNEVQPRVSNIQQQPASSSVRRTLREKRRISDDSSTIKNSHSNHTYPLRSRRNVVQLSLTCEEGNEDHPSKVEKQHVLHADKKTTRTTADNNDGSCNNVCNLIPVLELIPVSKNMKKPTTPSTWTETLCQPVACFCEVSTTEVNDNLYTTTSLPLSSQQQSNDDQVNVSNVQRTVTTELPLSSQQQSDDDQVNVSNVQKTVTTELPLSSQQQSDDDHINVSNVQTTVTTELPLSSQQQSDDDQVNVSNVQKTVTTELPLSSQQQSDDDHINVSNVQTTVTTELPLSSQQQSDDDQVNVSNVQKTVTTELPLSSQQQSDDDHINVSDVQTTVTTELPLSSQQRPQQSDQVTFSNAQKLPTTSTGTETSREIVASSCNISTAEGDNDPNCNVPSQRYDDSHASVSHVEKQLVSSTERGTSTTDDASTLENLYNNKIRKYHRYGSHIEKAPARHPQNRLDINQSSVSNIQRLGKSSTCSGVSSMVRSNCPDATSIEKEKERRAAEKALAEQQRMEYARLVPATFRQLQDIMAKPSGKPFQNFLAVVSDITAPKKSRGRDHYSKIYIVDPCFSQASLELMWFDQPEYFPNIYRPGEIVIWRDVKCQTHKYDLQLMKNSRTKITVIPWNDDPNIMKNERFPPVSFPEHFRKSVNFLSNWRQKNKDLFNAISFIDFSKEIDVGVYVNFCVRLCKLAFQENKVVFTVCDGNIPRFSSHDRREDTSEVASNRTLFDVTSEFSAKELIEINVKGEFAQVDNISEYRLKARDVVAFYGVFVKRSKRGNIKLVLTKTDIEPQGFIRVKREYVPNPLRKGDLKFSFRKW